MSFSVDYISLEIVSVGIYNTSVSSDMVVVSDTVDYCLVRQDIDSSAMNLSALTNHKFTFHSPA